MKDRGGQTSGTILCIRCIVGEGQTLRVKILVSLSHPSLVNIVAIVSIRLSKFRQATCHTCWGILVILHQFALATLDLIKRAVNSKQSGRPTHSIIVVLHHCTLSVNSLVPRLSLFSSSHTITNNKLHSKSDCEIYANCTSIARVQFFFVASVFCVVIECICDNYKKTGSLGTRLISEYTSCSLHWATARF